MRRAMGISLLVAFVLTVGAVAAQAAPMKKLTLSDAGVALVPGDRFEIFGERNVEVVMSIGDVECIDKPGRNGLVVSDVTNSKAVDKLELVGTSGALADEASCRTITESNPRLGYAFVRLGSGATLRLGASGRASLGPVSLRLQFEDHLEECTFKGVLKGSNSAASGPARLELELDHKLSLDRSVANTPGCPKSAELLIWLPFTLVEYEPNLIDEQT